uniref:Uncharacterized protein n=1 Tax=Coprothermobacter proteolyticus (strain ATCC 35245 / DSM 5265 / OCM 4 / BT) TaxID=309798 RepID=B5Y656_COPPD
MLHTGIATPDRAEARQLRKYNYSYIKEGEK